MLTNNINTSQEVRGEDMDEIKNIAYNIHSKLERIVHMNCISYTQASEFVIHNLDSFIRKDDFVFDSEKIHLRNR